MAEELQRTLLYDLHLELGAKMVPFAGYEMPLQYGRGILAEHLHAREYAVLFDVSHMGQAELHGADPALGFERLGPLAAQQHLEGHSTIELAVVSHPDHPVPPTTEFLQKTITPERGTLCPS